jgi:hypothetical protein
MKETADPILDKNRISKTFHSSQISMRLLCFQVYFLPLIHGTFIIIIIIIIFITIIIIIIIITIIIFFSSFFSLSHIPV